MVRVESSKKSEATVRQTAHRARGHVRARRPREVVDPVAAQGVAEDDAGARGALCPHLLGVGARHFDAQARRKHLREVRAGRDRERERIRAGDHDGGDRRRQRENHTCSQEVPGQEGKEA